jgi:hypothetical protein
MIEDIVERVRAWWYVDEEPDGVDIEYLKSGDFKPAFLTVKPGEDAIRCDFCGNQLPLKKTPEMVEHLAGHDEQGMAEVNPLQEHQEQAGFTLEDIKSAEGFDG